MTAEKSHRPPLHCTFLHCSRKTLRRKQALVRIGNEIKYLEAASATEAAEIRSKASTYVMLCM
jgi:hypothetical protein